MPGTTDTLFVATFRLRIGASALVFGVPVFETDPDVATQLAWGPAVAAAVSLAARGLDVGEVEHVRTDRVDAPPRPRLTRYPLACVCPSCEVVRPMLECANRRVRAQGLATGVPARMLLAH